MDYFGKDPRAMVDQVLSDLPKRLLDLMWDSSFYLSDLSWHVLFNGFYLDDATENRTLNLYCHSTSISWCLASSSRGFGPNREPWVK